MEIKNNTRNSGYVVESVFKTEQTDARRVKLEELLVKIIKASENEDL